MKYNPLRSSNSYYFYLMSALYIAGTVVLFLFKVLENTPAVWFYFILSSVGELYFLITTIIEIREYLKGKKLVITDKEITFYLEEEKKTKTISVDDLLEFKYDKKGKISFVYKKHGRTSFEFLGHVYNKKECALFDSIIEKARNTEAGVNLRK